jgi:hypothetical protein
MRRISISGYEEEKDRDACLNPKLIAWNTAAFSFADNQALA